MPYMKENKSFRKTNRFLDPIVIQVYLFEYELPQNVDILRRTSLVCPFLNQIWNSHIDFYLEGDDFLDDQIV